MSNRSIKRNKKLDLSEFGLRRTPFYKLSQKEAVERSRVKRKDFIQLLGCEQRLVMETQRRSQSFEKAIYINLEKQLEESRANTLDHSYPIFHFKFRCLLI
jgi:hypothetical protein